MEWRKARQAAEWAGGIGPKVLYAAVKHGDLKAARIGAGRNMLFCEEWITEWLRASAERDAARAQRPRRFGA